MLSSLTKPQEQQQEREAVAEPAEQRSTTTTTTMVTTRSVDIDQALYTPQFYCLWGNLFCNVTAGIGILACAKTMMSDVGGSNLPVSSDKSETLV